MEMSVSHLYTEMCIFKRCSTQAVFFLPSSYTQNTACERDSPQGPDAQHIARPSAINSMAKKTNPQRPDISHGYAIPESANCKVTSAGWQIDSTPTSSARSQRKGEKINANFIVSNLPHLGFYGIPGAWVGLSPKAGPGWGPDSLAGCPSLSPFLVIVISEPVWKSWPSACLSWDQSPEWDQSLEDHGGNSHLACTPPAAGVPSSSLFPESAAS